MLLEPGERILRSRTADLSKKKAVNLLKKITKNNNNNNNNNNISTQVKKTLNKPLNTVEKPANQAIQKNDEIENSDNKQYFTDLNFPTGVPH